MKPYRLKLKPKAPGERFPHRRHKIYRHWIASQNCVVAIHARTPSPCYAKPGRYKIECAHLRTRGAAGDDLGNTFPACPGHHDEQEGGTAEFEKRHGLDLEAITKELGERWSGLIPPSQQQATR